MKFEIKNRWSGDVQIVAEIRCDDSESYHVKLGLAIKWAIATRANLCGADLTRADLTRANLTRANLCDANLTGANLCGADLYRANLYRANLCDANLCDANLTGANLCGADLYRANLYRANLCDANLYGTKNAELAIARTRILPDGDIIGWKKCRDNVIVKLKIPADAKRSHAFGRKCRAEYAIVLDVIGGEVGISNHDRVTEYRVGETITPDSFDDNWQDECSNGIHFFITKLEAEEY